VNTTPCDTELAKQLHYSAPGHLRVDLRCAVRVFCRFSPPSVRGSSSDCRVMDAPISLLSLAVMGAVLSFATKSYSSDFPTVHFDPTPALLPVKKGKDQDEIEHVSIKTLLETRCPTLFTPFKPLWWLSK